MSKKDDEIEDVWKKFEYMRKHGASQENFENLKERFEVFSQIETIDKL